MSHKAEGHQLSGNVALGAGKVYMYSLLIPVLAPYLLAMPEGYILLVSMAFLYRP